MSKYDGKVVDRWYYAPENDDKKKVCVRLRLIKNSRDDKYDGHDRNLPPFETLSVSFHVHEPELGIEHFEGSDAEILRRAIWAQLDKRYNIEWESYYLVTVRLETPYRGLGTGFCLEYRDIEKGTTWDGKELLKEYAHRGWRIDPWPGEFRDEGGRIEACIPATPVNTKGLQEFNDRIATLREILTDFLSPEKILHVLADLAGVDAILPAPDPKLLQEEGRRSRRQGGRKKRCPKRS